MSTKSKVIITVLVFAIVGFMLNPNSPPGAAIFGAPAEASVPPTSGQIGALMLVGAIEAIAFGVGAAFLLFGLPMMRHVTEHRPSAFPAWLAVSWLLVSWVPHTALHMTAGDNIGKLIAIEYGFHVTLVAAGLILAKGFLAGARAKRAAAASGRAGAVGALDA